MWVRSRHGPGIRPIVLFDYDPTRSGEVPTRLLEAFKGYLQVDGYAGYDAVCSRDGVTRVGCMAHARRKFVEVVKTSKKPESVPTYILKLIGQLYKVEGEIKDLPVLERKKTRDREAVGILTKLKAVFDEHRNNYPPQSLMGKAITYAHNQWPYLLNYLKDGRYKH